MWYDRDIDALMKRTSLRPIPQGKISPGDGLAFGIILSLGSVILLGLGAGWFSAGLLAFSIFFYAVIYTMLLKRWTPQNIVIGGAAGAFPPLIGWSTVTDTLSWEPLWMFALIFLWTPPHFWALCLCTIDEYKKARVPMLPLVKGVRYTKVQILIYSFLLVGVSLLGYFWNFYGRIYLSGALLLGGGFILQMIKIFHQDSRKIYLSGFAYSIFYLFFLFGMMVVDRFLTRCAGI
jgi:protoheme IX farnesyltransferase